MQSINVTPRTLEKSEWYSRRAETKDVSRIISDPTSLYVDNKLVGVYIPNPVQDYEYIRRAVYSIKFAEGKRATVSKAMIARARVFGYAPRLPIRNLACRTVTLANDNPEANFALCKAAGDIEKEYSKVNKELADKHKELTGKVLKEYTMDGGLFTSGIVNDTNPLPYHFDSGNFKDVWSAMLCFKNGVEGGNLIIPELDVGFEIADKSLLLFDGQQFLHGVSPIYKKLESARRFTIVFYSLREMWKCLEPKAERDWFNKSRTTNERKRAGIK